MAKIHVGEKGLEFRVNVGISLLGLSTSVVIAKDPEGTTQAWATSTYDSRGILQYITTGADLSVQGNWSMQAKLVYQTGEVYWGDEVSFRVYTTLA
jgi:hypothetical protein